MTLNNQSEYDKLINYMVNHEFYSIQSVSEYHKHNRNIIITAYISYNIKYEINLCERQVVVNMTTIDRNDTENIKTSVHKYGLPICEYI